MAKAEQKFKSETYEKVVTGVREVPDGVTLELSQEEAEHLKTIVGSITGGMWAEGHRKTVDDLYLALGQVGISTNYSPIFVGAVTLRKDV